MADTLRVASFNVRNSRGFDRGNSWPFRRRAFAAAVAALEADVVGLQEVRPNQLRYLRRRFPTAELVGRGRDADGGGEHAAVLVRRGSWRLESNETRWLSAEPDRPGSRGWDAEFPRVATLVRLASGDRRIGILNVHLDAHGAQARREGAALIVAWLAAEADRPWVVVGDLNAPPGSPPLRVLTAGGYQDALAGCAGGTHHGFTGATDRTRIDHILVDPRVTVLHAEIRHERPDGRLPSDHWPVLADLRVLAPGQEPALSDAPPSGSWLRPPEIADA
jgi:endonuclease/exonuclease/phosphatase family metal-dependent hydrolase